MTHKGELIFSYLRHQLLKVTLRLRAEIEMCCEGSLNIAPMKAAKYECTFFNVDSILDFRNLQLD